MHANTGINDKEIFLINYTCETISSGDRLGNMPQLSVKQSCNFLRTISALFFEFLVINALLTYHNK